MAGPHPVLAFSLADLGAPAVQALVRRHLAGMHAASPPDSVHALGLEGLRRSDVTCWTAWRNGSLAGMGALRELDPARGEIKSMRVADAFLGMGVGRAILDHIMATARARGYASLWLETGSSPEFAPALALYSSAGFRRCGPFADYPDDPFSVFMTRTL